MSDINSGSGWYEVIHPAAATTEIVRVMEDGSIYCPEGVLTRDEFAFASARGNVHLLIRANEAKRDLDTAYTIIRRQERTIEGYEKFPAVVPEEPSRPLNIELEAASGRFVEEHLDDLRDMTTGQVAHEAFVSGAEWERDNTFKVAPEEQEWEYGISSGHGSVTNVGTREHVDARVKGFEKAGAPLRDGETIVRRRKVGLWVPVEGSDNDG